MNQRREPRFQATQAVAVTLFGEPDRRVAARVKNISGRGVGIECDEAVATGTALKIELDDALLLGEVIYCRRDEASFYVGVELEHALSGLGELSRMVSAFADPPSDSEQAHAVTERNNQCEH
jgi:hypothetical protein